MRAQAVSQDLLAGVRVLVVDDDNDSRDSLRDLFEWFGAETRTACSVAEARRAIEASRPDVLVSDLAMPDEDGFSLLAWVRARTDDRRDLPAVALSAYVGVRGDAEARSAGFQAVLGKPYELDHVVETVARLAEKRTRH
jgi:CheY-like chemotaxis protein